MNLNFYKISRKDWLPEEGNTSVYLKVDTWDDYSYKCTYQIILFDETGHKHDLGIIKIANFGQTDESRIELDAEFQTLGEEHFSLGQSPEYYSIIQNLHPELKVQFLTNLKDIIFDEELQVRALQEDVTKTSLLRDTSIESIKGQYKRILEGGAPLTHYIFNYETIGGTGEAGYKLSFCVDPGSILPGNVHVLIGRNGVGKTHLLNNMLKTLIEAPNNKGTFSELYGSFAGVVSVSYSAFDPFKPYEPGEITNGFKYSYIGLKKIENQKIVLKTPDILSNEFGDSIEHCFSTGKKKRWQQMITCLDSDPIFSQLKLLELSNDFRKEQFIAKFKKLSSGHAIVLLTLTKLVEKIEEKTLVLLDEPEAHLHPPLQSSFIRALSDLLQNRNAVAIIATHSPVIVQEVTTTCVWKLDRQGLEAKAERFEIETFGESIGTLTRDIFGLEVTSSGFYKLLQEEVSKGLSYQQLLSKYEDQLGFEAKLLLRALIPEPSNTTNSDELI